MTFWEQMVSNSTLAEADGDMWDHLTNPSVMYEGSCPPRGSLRDYIKESTHDSLGIIDSTQYIKLDSSSAGIEIVESPSTQITETPAEKIKETVDMNKIKEKPGVPVKNVC